MKNEKNETEREVSGRRIYKRVKQCGTDTEMRAQLWTDNHDNRRIKHDIDKHDFNFLDIGDKKCWMYWINCKEFYNHWASWIARSLFV
jgi:hypothetical protein